MDSPIQDEQLKTPESHPDHPTVGKKFRGLGVVYRCFAYHPRQGFWMRPEPADQFHKWFDRAAEVTCVSERAIGNTYHRIYDPLPSADSQGAAVDSEEEADAI